MSNGRSAAGNVTIMASGSGAVTPKERLRAYRELRDYLLQRARQLVEVAGITHPPVDLSRLTQALGKCAIVSLTQGLVGGGGVLSRIPGGYLIQVDSNANLCRQRFVTAHEVAHILLSEQGNGFRLDGTTQAFCGIAYNDLERVCNQGAAELLMPSTMMSTFLNDTQPCLTELFRVRRHFNVSYKAAAIQLVRNFWNAIIFFAGEKVNEEYSTGLQVRWTASHGSGREVLPRFGFIPDNSIVGRAHRAGPRIAEPEQFRLPLKDFSDLKAGIFQAEEVLPLGKLARLGPLHVEAARLTTETIALVRLPCDLGASHVCWGNGDNL
ncbi:ImmA/IrrE family metallo-endopeptidase [Chloroflexota bacterium]